MANVRCILVFRTRLGLLLNGIDPSIEHCARRFPSTRNHPFGTTRYFAEQRKDEGISKSERGEDKEFVWSAARWSLSITGQLLVHIIAREHARGLHDRFPRPKTWAFDGTDRRSLERGPLSSVHQNEHIFAILFNSVNKYIY
jgi:hypothetical protein